jgi:hypothetical protein
MAQNVFFISKYVCKGNEVGEKASHILTTNTLFE